MRAQVWRRYDGRRWLYKKFIAWRWRQRNDCVRGNPRNELAATGARKGTLLFKGKKTGNFYSGTAYVFSQYGPTAYDVSGPISDDQRQVTLSGRAPIKGSRCQVSSYRNDTLVFKFEGD